MERPFPPPVLWEEGGRTPDGHFRAVPRKRSAKDFFETGLTTGSRGYLRTVLLSVKFTETRVKPSQGLRPFPLEYIILKQRDFTCPTLRHKNHSAEVAFPYN